MGAILGGLGAALAWAAATACSTRSSRAIGPTAALGAVMIFGLALLLPVLAIRVPHDVSSGTWAWLAASGAANVGGLLMAYRALSTGALGVVSPIVSAEGGVTAVISVAAGQRLGATRAAALVGVISGCMLVDWQAGRSAPTFPAPHDPHHTEVVARAIGWAAGAACVFGFGLYATGQVAGDEIPLAWAIVPPRVIGVLLVSLPLLARRRLALPRGVLPYALGGGALEVAGFASYALGARSDVAVAAVMASITGAVAAGLGRLFFHERLARHQVVGIALIVVAVAVLGAE
jgi:drug/metabolite transporter (DMT)-like permease